MGNIDVPIEPDALLAHGDFVRAIARSLLWDEHAAEDVVQQTWLAALGAPGGRSRVWLGVVARNLAITRLRRDRRRLLREAAAARPERVPSNADVLERERLRRSVVDTVLALPEPYRTTVLLRYFEDLPPREVARQMGVPVETVRTRTRRALETLRMRLDAKHSDDQPAFCAALASWADTPRTAGATMTAATAAGGWLMGMKLVAATIVLVGAVAFFLWPSIEAPRERGAMPTSPPTDARSALARPRAAQSAPQARRPERASTAGDVDAAPTVNPTPVEAQAPEHWEVLLSRQQKVRRKLRTATITETWSQDVYLEERLRRLGTTLGVSISLDPSLPRDLAASPLLANWNGASAWDVLNYVEVAKKLSLRLTETGVLFGPGASKADPDPANVERYAQDPFTTFETALALSELDSAFHSRWSTIEECERAPVDIPAEARIASWTDLATSLGRSKCILHVRPADLTAELPSVSGTRRGPAIDVVRSWSPGFDVIVGRSGLESWQDGNRASAAARDKLDYERFRAVLSDHPWTKPSGDYSVGEIVTALEAATAAKVLVHPDAAARRCAVEAADSYFAILQAGGVRWTWAAGRMVVTTSQLE